MLAAVTTLSCAVPAALAEELVTLLLPPDGGLVQAIDGPSEAQDEQAILFDEAGNPIMPESGIVLFGEGVDAIVPGDSGADAITPPAGGSGTDVIEPGDPGTGGGLTFAEFAMSVAKTEKGLSVTISGGSPYEIEIKAKNKETGESRKDWIFEGAGTVSFELQPGTYTVTAGYVSNDYARSETVTLEAASSGGEGGADAITPPSGNGDNAGGADAITPPSGSGDNAGGADAITPPSGSGDNAGGADAITPPSGGGDNAGGADAITPPAVTYTAELTALTVTDTDEGKSTGEIKGTIVFTGDLDMVAKLYAAGSGEKIAEATLTRDGDGSFAFTGLAAGEYTLNAYFYGRGNEAAPVSVGCTVKPKTVTPGPDDVQPGDAVARFTMTAGQQDGEIYAVISGASNREIEVLVADKDGKKVGEGYSIGDGTVSLGAYAAGTYTVIAAYVTPSKDSDGADIGAVTASVTVPDGAQAPVQAEYKAIAAKVDKGEDYIIVTVTDAADQPMYLIVGNFDVKDIALGKAVRFDKLSPGTYDIEVGYVATGHGVSPFRTSVTIEEPGKLAPIAISQVVGGENQLVVVGTAEPATDVTFTTVPASTTTVIKTDAQGHFTVALTCEAGTYTKVSAQYGTDSASAVSFTGSFVVTAPAKKPTLTVDDVTTSSKTVTAKTTPGVVVELKADDYSQRVTADSEGLLHFSLPHTYEKGTKLTFTVYYGENNSKSFTQEVTVKEAETYKELEKGDKGDAVKRLTQRLKDLGYPVSVTSKYTDEVVTAVCLFQKVNGLTVSGVATKKTQEVLYSVGAIPYSDKVKYPTLVRGDRDMALIYTLQQRLKDLGYYTIKVDGIFGSGTERAVRNFQRVNGLTVTGKADSATQRLLYSSAAKPASYYGGDYKTLTRSSKYQSKVVPLQRRLKELGYYTGSIDGYFGSKTYRAVRNFQSRNGLDVTGKADPKTQQVLYSADAKKASGYSSSSPSSTGYRLLYWGCEGSAVKRLQNALIAAGYKSIVRTADGIYGQWTYDAVRAFQRDHGLAVDGVAGKNTQNALYGTNY